jgi:hypothetical protein
MNQQAKDNELRNLANKVQNAQMTSSGVYHANSPLKVFGGTQNDKMPVKNKTILYMVNRGLIQALSTETMIWLSDKENSAELAKMQEAYQRIRSTVFQILKKLPKESEKRTQLTTAEGGIDNKKLITPFLQPMVDYLIAKKTDPKNDAKHKQDLNDSLNKAIESAENAGLNIERNPVAHTMLKFLVNGLVNLATVGLFSLVHKATTGKWLLCDRTRSATKAQAAVKEVKQQVITTAPRPSSTSP